VTKAEKKRKSSKAETMICTRNMPLKRADQDVGVENRRLCDGKLERGERKLDTPDFATRRLRHSWGLGDSQPSQKVLRQELVKRWWEER
jgi:hypothetical protein